MDWVDVEMELSAAGREDLAVWVYAQTVRLRGVLDTIARVSDDPAIVTCAKHTLQSSFK